MMQFYGQITQEDSRHFYHYHIHYTNAHYGRLAMPSPLKVTQNVLLRIWITISHSLSLRAPHTHRLNKNTFIHYASRVLSTYFLLKSYDSVQLMFSQIRNGFKFGNFIELSKLIKIVFVDGSFTWMGYALSHNSAAKTSISSVKGGALKIEQCYVVFTALDTSIYL